MENRDDNAHISKIWIGPHTRTLSAIMQVTITTLRIGRIPDHCKRPKHCGECSGGPGIRMAPLLTGKP